MVAVVGVVVAAAAEVVAVSVVAVIVIFCNEPKVTYRVLRRAHKQSNMTSIQRSPFNSQV